MILPREKIEKACASGEHARPSLEVVHLDVENKRVVASNGLILAQVPVEVGDGDVSGPLPMDAIKLSRRDVGPRILRTEDEKIIVVSDKGRVHFDRPKVKHDIPSKADKIFRDPNPPFVVLDAWLLYRLAQAISEPLGDNLPVKLHLPSRLDGENALVVTPLEGEGKGMIMPYQHHETNQPGGFEEALIRLREALAGDEDLNKLKPRLRRVMGVGWDAETT
jgi:hypothetical protein